METATTTEKSAFADLLAAQKEIKNPTKSSTNPHFKNKYANLEVVIETVKDVLLKHGFCVSQTCKVENPGVLDVATSLFHAPSGAILVFNCSVPIEKMTPQAGMSAFTYGRRYGLLSALCLAAEDDDGNEATLVDNKKIEAAAKPTVLGLAKGLK